MANLQEYEKRMPGKLADCLRHGTPDFLSCRICRDGTMAQGLVPDYDYRIPYAMETHGVRSTRLKPIPEVRQLKPRRRPQQPGTSSQPGTAASCTQRSQMDGSTREAT